MPDLTVRRARLPALGITALFHVAVFFFLLQAIPKQSEPAGTETETSISLPPEPRHLPNKKNQLPAQAGSNAITPYFNPYGSASPQTLPPQLQGLQTALAACAPENYDMASDEIRTACNRIGLLVKNDPGHFGVTQDVADPVYWQRELARRQAPYLAPCMSPGGVDVLYTLYCIYDTLFHGYDPEKRRRYSQ
jgi:hypothetical protein